MKTTTLKFCMTLIPCLLFILPPCPKAIATPNTLERMLPPKQQTGTLQHSSTFEGRGDGQDFCPVSGEAIRNKHLKARYFGRIIYFCCEGCLKKAQREPDRYIKPTRAEQKTAVKAYITKVPAHPAGDEYCNE